MQELLKSVGYHYKTLLCFFFSLHKSFIQLSITYFPLIIHAPPAVALSSTSGARPTVKALVYSQKIVLKGTCSQEHLARRKLTSSTWESSDGWHHGEPNHSSNSPLVTSQRVSSPFCWCVCLLFSGTEAEYVCAFSPGLALVQNTIETHQGQTPQAPLDVTFVTIRQSTSPMVLWKDVCHCLTGLLGSWVFNALNI